MRKQSGQSYNQEMDLNQIYTHRMLVNLNFGDEDTGWNWNERNWDAQRSMLSAQKQKDLTVYANDW